MYCLTSERFYSNVRMKGTFLMTPQNRAMCYSVFNNSSEFVDKHRLQKSIESLTPKLQFTSSPCDKLLHPTTVYQSYN